MKNLSASVYELWKKHRCKLCLCFLISALCAIYAGVLSTRTFSPAEGWYSYYAYLINEEGAVPYLDFELLFPPLYTYLIAFITKIFGYAIMPLRIFGVIVYTLTGVFALLIFEKLTKNPWLGFLGGLLTIATLQSEVVQVFYDYIRLMDLSVYVSVYFFLRYTDRFRADEIGGARPDVNIIIGTVFAVFASMYKQSSGLIFLLFCFAFIIFMCICLPNKKKVLAQVGYMGGVTVLMYGISFAFMASKGALGAYLRYNFVSSVDAKGGGSILSVLFGWIPRSGRNLLIGALLTLIPLVLITLFVWLSRKYPAENKETDTKLARAFKVVFPTLAAATAILPLLWRDYASLLSAIPSWILMYVVFLFCTVFFISSAFVLIFRDRIKLENTARHYKYLFLSGVIFALAFSVCTSGGLAESQTALGYAFLPIALMSQLAFRKRELAALLLSALMVFQTAYGFGRKVICTYAWWGLSMGELEAQTETCDIPMLKGIKMSPAYARMYNNVYYGVINSTDPDDEIFVFPHMPVLYLATDRPRATHTAIQWFDVCTDSAIIDDIDVIKEKKPKVIVMCEINDYVISSHESSFRNGEKSGLHEMQDFLMEFLEEEEYMRLSRNIIPDGYVITVWRAPS
ncbi:MAG: hypothetical protein J6Q77_02870 [Clostridia bacterium]|nr:hypothetical protein [Clostridia bacterium]